MLEIQYEKFGPPSVVAKCVQVSDIGEPAAWDAIVEIEAVPVNPSDLAMLAGVYGHLNKPPATIGMEASGRVVAIGKAVRDLQIDDRVMIMANNNWGQRRKIPASLLQKVPNELDPLQVAMMKVNPATALLLLQQAGTLKPDDWVVQNAPLSNVGRAVIQIAAHKNIRTINLVRRQEAIQEVKALGGDIAILQSPETSTQIRSELGRGKIRLALDAVGGLATTELADTLDNGGTIVCYGMLSGEPCHIASEALIFRDLHARGFWLSKVVNRMSHQQRTELYDEVIEMLRQGTLHGIVDSCFPLTEIKQAILRAEHPDRKGKVLMFPNGQIDSSVGRLAP